MELLENFVLHLSRFLALPRLSEGELHQGEGGLFLSKPEGSPASEVLPCLSEEVCLGKGVLCLGEPRIAT